MRFANESHFPKQFSRIRSNGKEGHVISHDLPSRLKFACHWARRMEATTIQVEDLHAAFLEADASFNLNHTRQTMRHMLASGVLVPARDRGVYRVQRAKLLRLLTAWTSYVRDNGYKGKLR